MEATPAIDPGDDDLPSHSIIVEDMLVKLHAANTMNLLKETIIHAVTDDPDHLRHEVIV